MKKTNISYYLVGILILFIVTASNFVNIQIQSTEFKSIAIWFILSSLGFIFGWILNKISDWKNGGSLLIIILIFSVVIVILNSVVNNFQIGIESKIILIITQVLKSLLILSVTAFGFSFAENLSKKYLQENLTQTESEINLKIQNSEEKARMIIEKAENIKQTIIQDSQTAVTELEQNEFKLKIKLNELISAEKEILSKYELK
jgi:hypothetical protein